MNLNKEIAVSKVRNDRDSMLYELKNLDEKERQAFQEILQTSIKTGLSFSKINKVLYLVNTELYHQAMNRDWLDIP